MNYDAPKLTVLMPAINSIQTSETQKNGGPHDSAIRPDVVAAYADWED